MSFKHYSYVGPFIRLDEFSYDTHSDKILEFDELVFRSMLDNPAPETVYLIPNTDVPFDGKRSGIHEEDDRPVSINSLNTKEEVSRFRKQMKDLLNWLDWHNVSYSVSWGFLVGYW